MTSIIASPTIDVKHHKIHEGFAFQTDNVELNMLQNAAVNYLIITPLNTLIHFNYKIFLRKRVSVQIFENSIATGGIPLHLINKNRNSLRNPSLIISKSPTITNDGTLLSSQTFGNDEIAMIIENKIEDELVLKYNTKYIFRITSNYSSNNITSIFSWYEIVPTT